MPSREPIRARTNSSATAERYRPRTYSNPPPTQQDPSLLGPYQQPYTPPEPAAYPQQHPPFPQQAPYPQDQPPIPMPQPIPINPAPAILDPSSRHSSYTRPPMHEDDDDRRRHSYSSQRSRHSQHRPPMHEDDDRRRHSYSSQLSRHSQDSRRSRHSKYSRRSAEDDDEYYARKARKARKEHPSRTNERPTMGDSLVSVIELIKSALGPRDK